MLKKTAIFFAKTAVAFLILVFGLNAINGHKSYRNAYLSVLSSSTPSIGNKIQLYYKAYNDSRNVGLDIEAGLVSPEMISNAKKKKQAGKKSINLIPISLKLSSLGIAYLPSILFISICIFLISFKKPKTLLKFLLAFIIVNIIYLFALRLTIINKIIKTKELNIYGDGNIFSRSMEAIYNTIPIRIDLMFLLTLIVIVLFFQKEITKHLGLENIKPGKYFFNNKSKS